MHIASIAIIFLSRCLLIALFLPFSALDKVLNTSQAIRQAGEIVRPRIGAIILLAAGGLVEVVMSLGIVTGIADRFAAFVLAGYCLVTAVLWKRFWRTADFRLRGASRGREVFWDFLKNVALAGALFLFAFGNNAGGVRGFLLAPLASTHPYQVADNPGR